LILPLDKTNFVLAGSGDNTMPDVILRSCDANDNGVVIGNQPGEHHYRNSDVIVEVKLTPDKLLNGLRQSIMYTRHILTNRPDRLFAWSLVIAGTLVYALVFTSDTVLVSTPVDVLEREGRRRFVDLIVNWSLRPQEFFGVDPHIQRFFNFGHNDNGDAGGGDNDGAGSDDDGDNAGDDDYDGGDDDDD
ncbi:hypothetical protein IWW38_005140, partial [Coemansia aciculifera]